MSPARPRRKRVPPERSGPVRNPVVSKPPDPTNARSTPGVGAAFGATVDEGLRTAERLAEFSSAAVRGAVECGVQTAYTVIDEYMRRGHEAAGRNRERSNGRGEMNDDRQNFGNWSAAWGPMSPLMAQWTSAMRMWAEAWSTFVPGVASQQPWNFGAMGFAPPSTTAATPKVSVQVSSQYPTEVTASVYPGADAMTLAAEPLQMPDGSGAPSLVGVAITCSPGCVRVSVTVPSDQPAGCYVGAINDAGGKKCGDLRVVISDSSTGARRKKA